MLPLLLGHAVPAGPENACPRLPPCRCRPAGRPFSALSPPIQCGKPAMRALSLSLSLNVFSLIRTSTDLNVLLASAFFAQRLAFRWLI